MDQPKPGAAREAAAAPMERWFQQRGWTPWPFQTEAWQAFAAGDSGLIHVPTGAGKTYAAFGGPLNLLLQQKPSAEKLGSGLRIIYITPLRALARDIEQALAAPLADLAPKIRVESRTGDTVARLRARQQKQLPEVLITTPESLALMIARSDAPAVLSQVQAVLVDEWHELLTSKRGVQLQLTLSRLRGFSPTLRTWGMSATLRDPELAARALLAPEAKPVVVYGKMPRPVFVKTLLPHALQAFPWAGHLGLSMLPQLLDAIDAEVSNLVFTNTRSQAERWLQALRAARPEWQEILALHHGSLDRETREGVEEGLKSGRIRIVVATSSLDLGVDFPAVEMVFQIGSPKGLARLVQRAGRAAHRPLSSCTIHCIPTHGLELVEFAAARRALEAGQLEERMAKGGSLDVLAQHLVSCALGGGFAAADGAAAMLAEVRATAAYASLNAADFTWCLAFITTGGAVLDAYPAYHRVVIADGLYKLPDKRQAQLHRMNIGTIVADEQAVIKLMRGASLGRIDEAYIAKLKAGDRFVFAGHTLEFVKMYELTAYCRVATGKSSQVPAWQGTFMPLSLPLGDEMRQLLGQIACGEKVDEPEVAAAGPILTQQELVSLVPAATDLLLETWQARDGSHLFAHTFAGRRLNEAVATLLALRLSRLVKTTFAVVANDYAFGLISAAPIDYRSLLQVQLFSAEGLEADLAATVNAAEMAKRRFREIARIAGVVHQSYPGKRKGGRALHASSSLLYDTLARFDPDNRLIAEAQADALAEMSGQGELLALLRRLGSVPWLWMELRTPSPFSFPLVVETVRSRLGSENLEERVARMLAHWTGVAVDPAAEANYAGERPFKPTSARPKGKQAAKAAGEARVAGRPADARRRNRASSPRTRRLVAPRGHADRGGSALGQERGVAAGWDPPSVGGVGARPGAAEEGGPAV